MEGYCVKCKAKREIQNPTAGFNKRGSAVVFGTCPECGTKIYRIGRTALHEGMEAPAKYSSIISVNHQKLSARQLLGFKYYSSYLWKN